MVIYITLTIALLSGLYAYRYLRRASSPRTARRIYAAMGLAALLYVGISLAGELSLYTAARARGPSRCSFTPAPPCPCA